MATSPSDQNKRNVLSWLDRLQSSVRDAGSSAGPDIFTELRNREEVESDCASDTPNIEFADEELEGDGDNSEIEKLQNTLPDAHVPLGLIAKLSIDNNHVKGKRDRTRDVNITDDEDLNDDNVVCLCCNDHFSQPPDQLPCFKGVANETYFMPGSCALASWLSIPLMWFRPCLRPTPSSNAYRTTQSAWDSGARTRQSRRCSETI